MMMLAHSRRHGELAPRQLPAKLGVISRSAESPTELQMPQVSRSRSQYEAAWSIELPPRQPLAACWISTRSNWTEPARGAPTRPMTIDERELPAQCDQWHAKSRRNAH